MDFSLKVDLYKQSSFFLQKPVGSIGIVLFLLNKGTHETLRLSEKLTV